MKSVPAVSTSHAVGATVLSHSQSNPGEGLVFVLQMFDWPSVHRMTP